MTLNRAIDKPKSNMNLKIQSKKDSTISLLAIDKRITFLATGNDFNRGNIADSYSTYESDLHVLNDNLQNWSACSDEEKQILENLNAEKFLFKASFNALEQFFIFQRNRDVLQSSVAVQNTNQPEDVSSERPGSVNSADSIRDYFPETWIFETLDMGHSEVFEYLKKIPDSITSWIITAFSINKDHGFALAKPVELIVKQDFFIKLYVPYFIREGEVIKVDVIVFNYLESKQNADGMVQLNKDDSDNYVIVKKQQRSSLWFLWNGCNTFSTNDTSNSIPFSVSSQKSTKVSFYIQAIKYGKIKLKFTASTSDHRDVVHKEIFVEPEGITTKIDSNKVIDFTQHDVSSWTLKQNCTSSDLTISSDFISKSVKHNDKLEGKIHERYFNI